MADMGMVERVKAAVWNSLHDSLTEAQRAAIDFHNLTFDHAARSAIEAMQTGECICGKCGLRHGITANDWQDDPGF